MSHDDELLPPHLQALQTAIKLAGSRRELARRIACYTPCSAGRLDMWFHRGTPIPVEIAPFVALAVDGKVSVFDLCPGYRQGWFALLGLLKTQVQEQEPVQEIA